MNNIIVIALICTFVAVSTVLVVSACILSSQCRQAEEARAARVNELEDAIRETLDEKQGEWAAVGNHPASRYRRDVEYYQDLLSKDVVG